MARLAVAHFLLIVCLLTAGCSADSDLEPVSEAQQQAIIEAAKGSHRLQAGEKIRVTVSGDLVVITKSIPWPARSRRLD
jgi:uncharacterized protein YcfL